MDQKKRLWSCLHRWDDGNRYRYKDLKKRKKGLGDKDWGLVIIAEPKDVEQKIKRHVCIGCLSVDQACPSDEQIKEEMIIFDL